MSKIVLGLDLGITSIGWAIVKTDDINRKNSEIVDSGVRIFTIAEHPKDGKSLALPRREARSARRSTKRKAQRMKAIKRMLVRSKVITLEELEHLFIGNKKQVDVWRLRADGLKHLLTNRELARVMVHIAKHRGYASNRKSDESQADDKEGKAVLSGITANQKALNESVYETIGELIANKEKKRNANKQYENSIARSMLQDEITLLFERQKQFGNTLVDETLLQQYIEVAFSQRPLKSVVDMVANCPFEKDEKRAAQASYSFEIFRAFQKLKNIRMINEEGERALTLEQMHQAIERAKQTKKFTYKSLKTAVGLDKSTQFKGLVYVDHKTGEIKEPENVKLLDFSAFQKIKSVIETCDHLLWSKIDNDTSTLDAIATILSVEKDDQKALPQLKEIVPDAVAEALLSISFSKFGHLSTKAMNKIVPGLEEGLDYDKACKKAGYDFQAVFQGDKGLLLPPLSEQENMEMTNPVVKRAVAQMRLVYNALARKYGAIDAVHIELTRDIKRSHKDRNEIIKAQKEFQDRKAEARINAIEVLGKEPTAKELLKFRLWQEQDGCCVYSGVYIKPDVLRDSYATEIDHILPYSRSLDDSLNNKVLCFTKQNQDKGNQTPFEYMGGDTSVWNTFSVQINANKKLKQAKKSRLLKTNFDENSENAFKDRNKNDTSYLSKFIKNYIEAHIAFKDSKIKRHVFTMNGMLTSQLRYKWGVGDKNRDNHLHHAEDALILAFSTQKMVQELSTVSSKREGFSYKKREEKSKELRFITPMDEFHKKVHESTKGIFVSHMPRRKVRGAAHEATVFSKKTLSVTKENGKVDYLKGGSVTNNVELKHGLAKNDSMPRVDLFQHKKSKKYYLVPIYVNDFVKEKLPNKAIVSGNKPWLEMDDDYEFRFSFFKNDLMEIQTKKTAKKEAVNVLGYYDGTHSGTANITIKAHDGSQEYSYGSQNLVFIKKYQVDALGNYVEVRSEKRQGGMKEKNMEKLEKRKLLRTQRKATKVN